MLPHWLAHLWALGLLSLAANLPQDLTSSSPAGVGWDSLPALVWRAGKPGEPLSTELARAFGGVNVEGSAEDDWARELGLDFYIGHAPGRDDLHIDSDRAWYEEIWRSYWEEREPSVLVRSPCLSEESCIESLKLRLQTSLKARDGEAGLGISLGDEVSLTPWGAPLDLCESDACRASFADFLAGQQRWSFVQREPLHYPDTDRTRLAWIEGDPRHVGAWLARRDFHHRVLIEALEQLADRARELSPGTPVGLFGQSGRTAFGDVGVEQVLGFLDFLEVYRILDSRELLYTLRDEQQRSLLTLFREPDAPHGTSWLAWEHWLRGGDGFVIWSDADLQAHPQYAASLTRTIKTLRELDGQLPDWRPRPSGVAVIHPPDSLALSWLRDALNDGPTWMRRFASYQNENGTRELALRALLRLLEDSGYLPGSLPIDSIGSHTVSRFPLLVANHLLLLGADQRDGLLSYLQAGGRLIVLGPLGTYSRRGQQRGDGLPEWLGTDWGTAVREGQIMDLELDASRYLAQRFEKAADGSYVDRCRRSIKQLCGATQGSQPRWSLKSDGFDGPWLRLTQPAEEPGSWICAALPGAATPGQRALLKDLELELLAPADVHVRWIHPQPKDGVIHLPAGEAVIFQLTKGP
jgi:hypothetical protein